MTTPKSITRSRLTSAPALAGALLVVTLLAFGPLIPVDEALQGYWAKKYTPNWTDFIDAVPNAVAGQAVCLPVLLAIAGWLAWRHRTWHPLAIVVAAEAGFYLGIGSMKFLLARSYPSANEGHFWDGGILEHGWYGIAYPSGHAAEAILIYGAAAYLLRTYAEPDWRIHRRLNWIVGLITVNAVVVSFYLGFHWPSDLLAGLIAGALILRLIVDGDRAIAARRPYYGLNLHRFVPKALHLPGPQAAGAPRPALPRPALARSTAARSAPGRHARPTPAVVAARRKVSPVGHPIRPSIRIGEPHTWMAPRETQGTGLVAATSTGGGDQDRLAG